MDQGKNIDVIVVGSGVAGLAATAALIESGAKVGLARDPATPAVSWNGAAGLVAGGQNDNFTRVAHAHGPEFAKDLWQFGDDAHDALKLWCAARQVPFVEGGRLRLVTSPHELEEAARAVDAMRAAGFGATLERTPASLDYGPELAPRILAVQDDGPRGGWVSVEGLMKALERDAAGAKPLPAVRRIDKEGAARMVVTFADGSRATSEMVLVAAHLGTGALVPELAGALVSVADQWSLWDTKARGARFGRAGLVFSLNHTYEWGVTRPDGALVYGGGRYLRPMAGIEATVATKEPKIEAHLAGQLAKSFAFGADAKARATCAGLDCRPCDELPIIGPMFGEGRILVAVGFMGQGLTQGFHAGRCLAELVTRGAAPSLPRRLWPERLRSLEG